MAPQEQHRSELANGEFRWSEFSEVLISRSQLGLPGMAKPFEISGGLSKVFTTKRAQQAKPEWA